jgi:putative transcriptional regulator
MPDERPDLETSDLETPVLLAAMPQIQDPFFNHGVVLLIDHQPEGSFGLIINRPTELTVREVLDGLELEWKGAEDVMTHFGGPVQPQMGTVLFHDETVGHRELGESSIEILPGIRLTQHIGDLAAIAAQPPSAFRLLLGYAGWGEGQLEQELERNDWLIAPLDAELLFSSDTEGVWNRVLDSLDIDPVSLPAWTQVSDKDRIN